jgi:hypothetical protein
MSWADYYDWLYQHPPASSDMVVVGSTRARVAPLARWLLCRWSRIQDANNPLSLSLQHAGWYPPQGQGPGNSDYRDSFSALTPDGQVRRGVPGEVAAEARGAAAGRRYFQTCTAAYVRGITDFGESMRRYMFPSRTIPGLGEPARTQFQTTVAHWERINTDLCLHGAPPSGLPYGPAPRAQIYGSHRERVSGMVRLFAWRQRNPTRDPSSSACRGAGIHYPAAGLDRSVGPAVQPWF